MRVAELKALARECGLRGYSQMRKPEIIELIRNNRAGLLIYLRGPTKLSQLGSDLIVQDSLHGLQRGVQAPSGLLNKKWINLSNKK